MPRRRRRCRGGHDGPLVDGPPKKKRRTVNIETVCRACGIVVMETSWRKDAWNRMKKAERKKAAKVKSKKCIRPECDRVRVSPRHVRICRRSIIVRTTRG